MGNLMKRKKLTKEQVALAFGFKSGLEEKIALQIFEKEDGVEYEFVKIKYTQPEKKRSYRPDFRLNNGIFIETKGRFTLADRQKHLWIKEQYPEIDIRFVFTNPKALLRKGAKSTYEDWCVKNEFQYAKGNIPNEWFK